MCRLHNACPSTTQAYQSQYHAERYYHPDEFKHLKDLALEQGFSFVASGPMVRSSYKAGEFLQFLGLKK